MEFRRAKAIDFEQMLELQQVNLLSSLGSDELSDGFLNTAFSLEHFQQMNESLAVIVAVDQNRVCGYLCAATLKFNEQFQFPAALVKHAGSWKYQNKALTDYHCCLVNPVCVDKNYRGTEIFMGLCQKMLPLISVDYEITLAFVSTKNQRSLHACQKMMQVCDEFEVQEKNFWMLMRDLARKGAS